MPHMHECFTTRCIVDSIKLHLDRFRQGAGECAVAAAASVANFFDKEIDYKLVRKIANTDGDGLYTPQIGMLLNQVGFDKVTIISADLKQLDFDWQDLPKDELVQQLKRSARWHPDEGYREPAAAYVQFLTDEECHNELIIGHHFGRYIRKYLSKGIPVMASFNWHLFFNYPKWDDHGEPDALKGDYEEHEVVICGFDEHGVDILDSHYEMYYGKLAKYKNGRYRMDWETLHTVMGFGDLIIPQKFVMGKVHDYELV